MHLLLQNQKLINILLKLIKKAKIFIHFTLHLIITLDLDYIVLMILQ